MKNIKNLMLSKHYACDLTPEEVLDIEAALYGPSDEVLCVDATHTDCQGDDDEDGRVYTWYIPYGNNSNIDIDDILLVEQNVGCGYALVKAVSVPYEKTRAMHIADIHPYCRVVRTLGQKYKHIL